MTISQQPPMQRRGFLRGGALVAATAGGAIASAASTVLPAQAAADSAVLSFGFGPVRLLDTRTSEGRQVIVDTSTGAFDSKHRLKKYAWLDVAVYPTDDVPVLSAYVNLGSRASTAKGTLAVTAPYNDRPEAWTLHYAKGAEINNSAIAETVQDDADGVYVVRIYAGSVTHVILDLTGLSALLPTGSDDLARRQARAQRFVQNARSLR